MKAVSQTYHLLRRNGVWYYRRRVPGPLVQTFGKHFVQRSLGTTSLAEAKKLRAVEDLKWTTQFEAAEKVPVSTPIAGSAANGPHSGRPISEREVVRLVQAYVEEVDGRRHRRLVADPPDTKDQRDEIILDAATERAILHNPEDIRGDEMVYRGLQRILSTVGAQVGDVQMPYPALGELVRRGLMETVERHLARLEGDHSRPFFDHLFSPDRRPEVSFVDLCDQFTDMVVEEAEANGTNPKWVDKQKANISLLREIIGDATPIHEVDYDACLRVRSLLARIPANRNKLYPDAPIDAAIARAEAQGKPPLSSITQEVYLGTLRSILDLATKKRLIPVNPADGMKPVRRDAIASSARRRPFTLEQIKQFFASRFYQECARYDPPYSRDPEGWRFWLPLLCLFMGMRPNEACQMGPRDLKRTRPGTYYVEVIASEEEGEDSRRKTVKTASSRRRIPVHPELIKIGFLVYVEERLRARHEWLFPDLQPDRYGNHAAYALKRFRESFLPQAIALERRQSFYSFRHSFRDALRRIEAPPDALQALGGWSQGKLTSDDYGDKSDPDYQVRFMSQVEFGLDLSNLRVARQ
jgi:integrase